MAFLNPLLQFTIHFLSKIIRLNCEKYGAVVVRLGIKGAMSLPPSVIPTLK